MNQKKATVKESLSYVKLNKKKPIGIKLKGKYLFKAGVRLVIEYIEWLKNEDNELYKIDDKSLSIKDRSILLTEPNFRSKQEKIYVVDLIKKFNAFKKYPDKERQLIAKVIYYKHFKSQRVIVRQNHPAKYLYFIIKGEVELSKIEKDNITGDIKEINAGVLGPGDMFGEVALLHSISRSTTVISQTSVDFFCLDKSDFDQLLKNFLLQNWNVLQDALVNFNYFKSWDDTTIRECCVLSKIKDFEPNEILLGDGKGMVNYVYFLLSGMCRLIEHMLVFEEKRYGKINYRLYDPEKLEMSRRSSKRPSRKSNGEIHFPTIKSSEEIPEVKDFTKKLLSKKIKNPMDFDRESTITTTLQEVVNQWHEITDVATALMRKPSTLSEQTHPGVKTIFIQICEFHRGACFGLGEEMRNRRIVSTTSVRCLLIPRYWLLEHNHANIWQRVKVFMNSKYPTRDKLFQQFVINRKWTEYKKQLLEDVIKKSKKTCNNTTIHDVPYSIRINSTSNCI
ncbi:uncharacterized protein LOC130678026 [Microplitis mediator]|uniref:uncharacterized protein LOC130678026 n=1 Tax=Microplitis mediator TaxID=375433 RepID=UPI0025539F18|nr:uncharacterized protein LOC130678026 [Microplitis mediator]